MTPAYDCSRFAERLGIWNLEIVKKTMLEAIANIAVAVHDKDTDRMAKIQCDLMWCYDMSEQRVTRNVLNLLTAATALAEILDYPIIKGRINIGFKSAAELIKNVQTAARVVSDDALEASEEVVFIKSKLREL